MSHIFSLIRTPIILHHFITFIIWFQAYLCSCTARITHWILRKSDSIHHGCAKHCPYTMYWFRCSCSWSRRWCCLRASFDYNTCYSSTISSAAHFFIAVGSHFSFKKLMWNLKKLETKMSWIYMDGSDSLLL